MCKLWGKTKVKISRSTKIVFRFRAVNIKPTICYSCNYYHSFKPLRACSTACVYKVCLSLLSHCHLVKMSLTCNVHVWSSPTRYALRLYTVFDMRHCIPTFSILQFFSFLQSMYLFIFWIKLKMFRILINSFCKTAHLWGQIYSLINSNATYYVMCFLNLEIFTSMSCLFLNILASVKYSSAHFPLFFSFKAIFPIKREKRNVTHFILTF